MRNETNPPVTLVIFTCEGRELLLKRTIDAFRAVSPFMFSRTILAVDGPFAQAAIDHVKPDLLLHMPARGGYVKSIAGTLRLIDTPYFFWLEDDWHFPRDPGIARQLPLLAANGSWAQITWSKYGPLDDDQKLNLVYGNLYRNPHGFSANPCLCNTVHISSAFRALEQAAKGDTLGVDGFENFLTRFFDERGLFSLLLDPVDHDAITHEGYLESTERNWHMTNSLDVPTSATLLTIPKPSLARRLLMAMKLLVGFAGLAARQLFSDRFYEHAFRVLASIRMMNKKNGRSR